MSAASDKRLNAPTLLHLCQIKLLELLAAAIRSGHLRLIVRNPDRYVGVIGSLRLSADQLHFYDSGTVSLGYFDVRLRLGPYGTDLWMGTPGMERFWGLLALQFPEWNEHLIWIAKKARREIQTLHDRGKSLGAGPMQSRVTTGHMPFISLLKAIRDVTIQRELKWKRSTAPNRESYRARIDGASYVIEFVRPLIQTRVGPGPAIARVTTHGIALDFCEGTEGWQLVQQVISLGNHGYERRLNKVADTAREVIERLQKLLAR